MRSLETVWVPAIAFVAGTGTPAMSSTASRAPVWLLDPTTSENIRGSLSIPPCWVTAKIELVWTNGGAGTGSGVFTVIGGPMVPGVALADTIASGVTVTDVAPVLGTPSVALVISGQVVTSGPQHLRVQRQAVDAGDTLTTDAAVLGVLFTRLT